MKFSKRTWYRSTSSVNARLSPARKRATISLSSSSRNGCEAGWTTLVYAPPGKTSIMSTPMEREGGGPSAEPSADFVRLGTESVHVPCHRRRPPPHSPERHNRLDFLNIAARPPNRVSGGTVLSRGQRRIG